MIIITGPGRSGTSLLAQGYHRAGVDPGGSWDDVVRAGFEDPVVVDLNKAILRGLRTSQMGSRRSAPRVSSIRRPTVRATANRVLTPQRKRSLIRIYNELPWNRSADFEAPQWQRLASVVARHRDAMVSAAQERVLVKDPQFCLTLPAWLAAGADIEFVIATTRAVDPMLQSRSAAGQTHFRSSDGPRNALLFSMGSLWSTLMDAPHLDHVLLRFPDFIADPRELGELLPVPEVTTRQRLVEAFAELIDPSMHRPS